MFESRAGHGDVTGEYRALRNSAGLVAHTHDLVTVTGPEVVPFLQGIVSQDVDRPAPGDVVRSFLLGPEGKLRALLWLFKGVDRILVLTDPGRGPLVVEDLSRYRFRVEAEVSTEVEQADSLCGPAAASFLTDVGTPVPAGWDDQHGIVGTVPLGRLPRYVVAGVDRARLVGAGARPAGIRAYTAVRVEAGEPRMGVDVDEKTIPHETGLVDASVSFAKGCYLGQELVARIDSRGHVNRILRGVVIGDGVQPPDGAELVDGDRVVGTLSSVTESPGLGAPIGLALVRHEVEPPCELEVRWTGGSCGATVRSLPLSDFTES